MELLIEHFEKVLVYVGTLAKMFLEVMGILTVTGGIILNFPDIIRLCHHPSTHIYSRVRINVARSLALALEFQLGADIVATTVSATYGNLVKLAIVAIIRTFLNYFLSQEIKEIQESNSHPK